MGKKKNIQESKRLNSTLNRPVYLGIDTDFSSRHALVRTAGI